MAKMVYRSDQVGSLLRPPRLLDARDAFKSGKIDRAALTDEEDAAVVDVLARQRQIGLSIYSDGEMRRDAWQTVFSQAVAGFAGDYPIWERRRPDGETIRFQTHTKTVETRLERVGRLAERDATFLRDHAPGPFKITLPSPAFVARGGFKAESDAYADREALLDDTAAIIREEMAALVRDGASYIQLDEGFVHHLTSAAGGDPTAAERDLMIDIAAENACHDAVRSDTVTTAIHVCRGSRMAWAHGVGTYDWLAERLFNALHADRFVLEYDTEIVGGFAPLRFLPKGKVVALGLVSSKEARVETRDELMRRIDEAARYCPIERLALTTQCGFQGAATRDGAHVDYETQWRKLERIAEVASEVWQ